MDLFNRILEARGLFGEARESFLNPDYKNLNNPLDLPDIGKAVKRLVEARKNKESILVYGDYDIDGLTSTSLLLDGLDKLGFEHVDYFIPNRFSDGYGLSLPSLKKITKKVSLIITVDCGSLSHKEVEFINSQSVDIIITDHHNIDDPPPALAVINPKRLDSKYGFGSLAGVGVVFKLIQALQREVGGLGVGQEKWLLDLVCLGTICDIVPLIEENRVLAYWGLEVLKKTRRPGLRALIEETKTPLNNIDSGVVGFRIGPRMNAAGRLKTAESAIKLLNTRDKLEAKKLAKVLDDFNYQRQLDQSRIVKEAILQAKSCEEDKVIVLASPDWSSGIIGIVASKLVEYFKKPVYIFQDLGDELKGSARSFGDFDVAGAINSCRRIVINGGGHKLAAGVSLKKENLDKFKLAVNNYYKQTAKKELDDLKLEDVEASLSELDEETYSLICKMEPFGNGNPRPVIKLSNLIVRKITRMGSDNQHAKYGLSDGIRQLDFLEFNSKIQPDIKIDSQVDVWCHLDINEWRGTKTVQGKIIKIEVATN